VSRVSIAIAPKPAYRRRGIARRRRDGVRQR